MRAIRFAKMLMVASLALYVLLVVFANLTDYNSNYIYLRHVVSMDTTFPGNQMMYRAITSPILQQAMYIVIIALEAVVGLLFAYATWRLWQARGASEAAFAAAKTPLVIGATVAFFLWFVIFLAIGGEWFVMWQSTSWNGQEPAFRFVVCILLITMFVTQKES
jgi:predicted small integral membrane protein